MSSRVGSTPIADLYAYTTNSPHQSIVLHVCHHCIILSYANLSQTQTLSPLLLYFVYCHPFYVHVHHLWNITYVTTHPLCPYLMLSSLKPLLSSYPLMVLVSQICKRFYLNIPLISLIHMTIKLLQTYVRGQRHTCLCKSDTEINE